MAARNSFRQLIGNAHRLAVARELARSTNDVLEEPLPPDLEHLLRALEARSLLPGRIHNGLAELQGFLTGPSGTGSDLELSPQQVADLSLFQERRWMDKAAFAHPGPRESPRETAVVRN